MHSDAPSSAAPDSLLPTDDGTARTPHLPSQRDTGRRRARRLPAASQLLVEALGAGVVSARQAGAALGLEPAALEGVCRDGMRLPLEAQRALGHLVLQHAAEHPEVARRARALLAQSDAAQRVADGGTICHTLAPVYWR